MVPSRPLFESRVLRRRSTQGSASVWSEAVWAAALTPRPVDSGEPLVIGCDVARFGDDFTSIIVRRGCCVLHHETHNGWTTAQTAGRLKQIAAEFSPPGANARKVEIYIDDDGVGGGVVDQADGYAFLPVSSAQRAIASDSYPNKRSEHWFAAADRRLDLSRLTPESQRLIQRQLMAPTWKLDSQGRRVVEPKSDTKRRIGRSPDDADALNLAFAAVARLESDSRPWAEFWGVQE